MRHDVAFWLAIVWTLFCLFATAPAQEIQSIQLVGNFAGLTCDPENPANNMEFQGDSTWRKAVPMFGISFPDTIFFKFTKNGSYLPSHWGWSGTWGVAQLDWDPPNIATIIQEEGYYFFYFRTSDYRYWIDRAAGSISVEVLADGIQGAPEGTVVSLLDSLGNILALKDSCIDDRFLFDGLDAARYGIHVHSPGYRDTTASFIELGPGEKKELEIHIEHLVAVAIAQVSLRRVEGGVVITWCTAGGSSQATFDIMRSFDSSYSNAARRNNLPICGSQHYEFFDADENCTRDLYYWIVDVSNEKPSSFGPLMVPAANQSAFLGQNYPNPFNPSTTIPFSVSAAGAGKPIGISFYDASGRMLERYELGRREEGKYEFRWNPGAKRGGEFPSGVYYCKLSIGKEVFTIKLILLR